MWNGRAEAWIANGWGVEQEQASACLYRGFVLGQLPSGKWEVEDLLGACVGVEETLQSARRLVDSIRG